MQNQHTQTHANNSAHQLFQGSPPSPQPHPPPSHPLKKQHTPHTHTTLRFPFAAFFPSGRPSPAPSASPAPGTARCGARSPPGDASRSSPRSSSEAAEIGRPQEPRGAFHFHNGAPKTCWFHRQGTRKEKGPPSTVISDLVSESPKTVLYQHPGSFPTEHQQEHGTLGVPSISILNEAKLSLVCQVDSLVAGTRKVSPIMSHPPIPPSYSLGCSARRGVDQTNQTVL